jgi:hypothetical protein
LQYERILIDFDLLTISKSLGVGACDRGSDSSLASNRPSLLVGETKNRYEKKFGSIQLKLMQSGRRALFTCVKRSCLCLSNALVNQPL